MLSVTWAFKMSNVLSSLKVIVSHRRMENKSDVYSKGQDFKPQEAQPGGGSPAPSLGRDSRQVALWCRLAFLARDGKLLEVILGSLLLTE